MGGSPLSKTRQESAAWSTFAASPVGKRARRRDRATSWADLIRWEREPGSGACASGTCGVHSGGCDDVSRHLFVHTYCVSDNGIGEVANGRRGYGSDGLLSIFSVALPNRRTARPRSVRMVGAIARQVAVICAKHFEARCQDLTAAIRSSFQGSTVGDVCRSKVFCLSYP